MKQMYTFQELQQSVNKAIAGEKMIHEPRGLYEPIEYALQAGGKRIRPVLALMAYNLFADQPEKIMKPAIGLEVFHNFTLVHDDIMDQAEIRRNKPTVHKKWDSNVAILSGDAMFIKAYEYLFTYEGPNFKEILKTFNDTALEVCEGQQYDMEFEDKSRVTEKEYLRMIELKTAVLLACSLKLGALMGNASARDADLLYQFGLSLGLAFQLQDDFLDAFGDSEIFGKKIGGDILENKKTYLYIKALEQASAKDAQALLNLYQEHYHGTPEEKIRQVIDLFEKYHVPELIKEKMDAYFQMAKSSIEQVSVDPGAISELLSLADSLMARKM